MEKEVYNSSSQKDKIKKLIEELKEHNITKQELILSFLEEESQVFDEKTVETLERVVNYLKEIKIKKIKIKTGYIPIKIFSDRTLSSLEHIITHLKEHHELSYQEIANLLNRNPRTIWTTYQRAKKKRG